MFSLFGRRTSKGPGNVAADAPSSQLTYFWVPDKEEVYELGLLADQGSRGSDVITVQYVNKSRGTGSPGTVTVKRSDCLEAVNYSEEASKPEDLVKLSDVNPAAILNSTRLRFKERNIFTSMGSIIMLVNPFERIAKNYGDEVLERYRNPHVDDLPTHLYLIPSRAYMAMANFNQNQAILISGESGAGKTEATKESLAFLTFIASRDKGANAASPRVGDSKAAARASDKPAAASSAGAIASKIVAASPILEAFGNAKTVRNPNSSRFGKWMVLHFNSKNEIVGSTITSYLLEKSRITQRSKLERNYHIFYQLLRGAAAEKQEFLRIKGSSREYKLLCGDGGQEAVDLGDKAVFKETFGAFLLMGFSEDDFWNVMKVVAAVLHLGELVFETGADGESASISADSKPFIDVCLLLEAAKDPLSAALTSSIMSTGGNRSSITTKRFSVAKAVETRDSLMRALYSRLFLNIISRINDQNMITSSDSSAKYIGLLDIFGFEIFEQNSFEQLCINYCNEMLQNHFNYVIFTMEKQLYEDEGITCSTIECTDNLPVITDIERSFQSLDEESRVPKPSSKAWLDKMKKGAVESVKKAAAGGNYAYKTFEFSKQDVETFAVCHYAGKVLYSASSFLEKNSETINNDIINAMNMSKSKLVKALFGESVTDSPQRIVSKSVSWFFKDQLSNLMQMLKTTQSHFIRCIKSNDACKPLLFDASLVSKQLLYSGVFEVVKIQQSGLPMRISKETFLRLYTCLVPIDIRKRVAGSCDNLLTVIKNQNIDLPHAQVGRKMVFFKSSEYNKIEARRKVVEYESSLLMQQWLREAFFRKTLRRYLQYLLLCKEVQGLLDSNRLDEARDRIQAIMESVGRHTVVYHIDIFGYIVTEVQVRLQSCDEQVLFLTDLEKARGDYSLAAMDGIKDLISRATKVGLHNNETIAAFSELLRSYEKGVLLCSIRDDDYGALAGLTVSDIDQGLGVLSEFPFMFADAPAAIARATIIRAAYIKEIEGYVAGLRECLDREAFVTDDQGRLGVARKKASEGRVKDHTLSSFFKTIASAEIKSQECRNCYLDCERYLKVTDVLLPKKDMAGIVALLDESEFADAKLGERMHTVRIWATTQIAFDRLAESFQTQPGPVPGSAAGDQLPARVDAVELCAKQFGALDPKYPAAVLLLRSAASLINLRRAFLSEKWGAFQTIFSDIADNDEHLVAMPEFALELEACKWQVQYRGFIGQLSRVLQADFFSSTITLPKDAWAASLKAVAADKEIFKAASSFSDSNCPELLNMLPMTGSLLALRATILLANAAASQVAYNELSTVLITQSSLDDLTQTLLTRDLAVCSSLLSFLHLETALVDNVSRLDESFFASPDKEVVSSVEELVFRSEKLSLAKCPPDFANDIVWYKSILAGLAAVVSTPPEKGTRFLWQETLDKTRVGSGARAPSDLRIEDAYEELSLECTRRLVTCGFLELIKGRGVFGSTGCLLTPERAPKEGLGGAGADYAVLGDITDGLSGVGRERTDLLRRLARCALDMRAAVAARNWISLESALRDTSSALLASGDAAIGTLYGEDFADELSLCTREVGFHKALSELRARLQAFSVTFVDAVTVDTALIDETPIIDASDALAAFESENEDGLGLVAISAALETALKYMRGDMDLLGHDDLTRVFSLHTNFGSMGIANQTINEFVQFIEYKHSYDFLYRELVEHLEDFLENKSNLSKTVYRYKYSNPLVTEHTKVWIKILFLAGNIISMLRSQEWRAVLSSLDLLETQLQAATCPNRDFKFKHFLSEKCRHFRELATRNTLSSMMSIISTTGQVKASTYETKFSVATESILIIEGALDEYQLSASVTKEANPNPNPNPRPSTDGTAAREFFRESLAALLDIRRAAARENALSRSSSGDSVDSVGSAGENSQALPVTVSQKFLPENFREISGRIEGERRLLIQKQTLAKMLSDIEQTFCENKLLLWDGRSHCIEVGHSHHRLLISQLEAVAASFPQAVHDVLLLRVVERAVSVASIVDSARSTKNPDVSSRCQSLQGHVKTLHNLKTLLDPRSHEGVLSAVAKIIVLVEDEIYLSDSFAALLTRGCALIEARVFDIKRFSDLCEEVAYAMKAKDLHSKISSKNDAIIKSVGLARNICGQMLDIGHAISSGAQESARASERLLRAQAELVSASFAAACAEWINGLMYPKCTLPIAAPGRPKVYDVPFVFSSAEYDLATAVSRVSCGSELSMEKVYKYSLEDVVMSWAREQCAIVVGGIDMETCDVDATTTVAGTALHIFPYSLDDEALGKLTRRLAAVLASGRVTIDQKVQAIHRALAGVMSFRSYSAQTSLTLTQTSLGREASPSKKTAAAAQEPLPPSIVAVNYCSYIIKILGTLAALDLPPKSHVKTDVLKVIALLERFRERVYHTMVGVDMVLFDPWSPAWFSLSTRHLKDSIFKPSGALSSVQQLTRYIESAAEPAEAEQQHVDSIVTSLDSSPFFVQRLVGMYMHRMDFISSSLQYSNDARAAIAAELSKHHAQVDASTSAELRALLERATMHPELLSDDSTALLAEIWQLLALSTLDLNDLVIASTAADVFAKVLPKSNGFAPIAAFIDEFTPILTQRVAVKRLEVYLDWAINNLDHVDRVDAEVSFITLDACSPLHLSIARWCIANRCLSSSDIASFFPDFIDVRGGGEVGWIDARDGSRTTLPAATGAMLLQHTQLLHYRAQAKKLHSCIMTYLADLVASTSDVMTMSATDISKFVDDQSSRIAWTYSSALLADTYDFSKAFNQLFSSDVSGGATSAMYGMSTSSKPVDALLVVLKSLLVIKNLFATISCDRFNRFPYVFSVVMSRLFVGATPNKKPPLLKTLLSDIESLHSGFQDLQDFCSSKRFNEGIAIAPKLIKSIISLRSAQLPRWADRENFLSFLQEAERRVTRQRHLCEELALARDVTAAIDSMPGFANYIVETNVRDEEGSGGGAVLAADHKENLYMCLADPANIAGKYAPLVGRMQLALAADAAAPLWADETTSLCRRALLVLRLRPVRARAITVNSEGILIPYSPKSAEDLLEMFVIADQWYSSIPDPYCGIGSFELKATLSFCINFRTRNFLQKINATSAFDDYERALVSARSSRAYVKLEEYVADLTAAEMAFERKVAGHICSTWALKMMHNSFTCPEFADFDIYADSSQPKSHPGIDYRLMEHMLSAALEGKVSDDVDSLVVTPSSFKITSYPADPSHSDSSLLIDNLSQGSIECVNKILAKDLHLLSRIPSFDKISREVQSSVFASVFTDVSATTLLASTHLAASQTLLRRSIALRVYGRHYDFTQNIATATDFLDFIKRQNSYVMDYLESSNGIVDESEASNVLAIESKTAGSLPPVARKNMAAMRSNLLAMSPQSRSHFTCADMLRATLQDVLDSNESIMDVGWDSFLQSHIPNELRVLITAASQTLNLKRIRQQIEEEVGATLSVAEFLGMTRSDIIALFFQSYKHLHLLFVEYKAAYRVLMHVNDVFFEELERQNRVFATSVEWTLQVRFSIASQDWARIELMLADAAPSEGHVSREGYQNLLTIAAGVMAHNRALDALKAALSRDSPSPSPAGSAAVRPSSSRGLFHWIDRDALTSLVSAGAALLLQTRELNSMLKISLFVVALQVQIASGNWYADTSSHIDQEQEVNRILGGTRPVDAVDVLRPQDFERWRTTSVSNLLNHEQPSGPHVCPKEVMEEIGRCAKECESRRVEYYLSRAVQRGREYIYRHIDFSSTVETRELQLLLSEVSGLDISPRNSALYAAGWVVLRVREAVKAGDWVAIRHWLGDSQTLDLTLAHEARLEIEELRRISRDNEKMHSIAAAAFQRERVEGIYQRLDISGTSVAEIIAVLKLTFALPVVSSDDKMMLYSAEKLKNIRINILMRNYSNLNREVVGADQSLLLDSVLREVLLVKHALDFTKVLENVSYHIDSDRLRGSPGSVNVNSVHSSKLKSFLDSVDESKCSAELRYYLSAARRVQHLRMAVKGNRWGVAEASQRALRYVRVAGSAAVVATPYTSPAPENRAREQPPPSDSQHRTLRVRHIDFHNEVFGHEWSDTDSSSAAASGSYLLIDGSDRDRLLRRTRDQTDRRDVRGSSERAAMLMTLEALDKAHVEYEDARGVDVCLSRALFPADNNDSGDNGDGGGGDAPYPAGSIPHVLSQHDSVLGLAEMELLLVRDELYNKVVCHLLHEVLSTSTAAAAAGAVAAARPSIAEAIMVSRHLGVKSWECRRLLNTAMLQQDIRSLLGSMGGIGSHTTPAELRRVVDLLSKAGLLKSKDLFDPAGAAEIDTVFAAVCKQQIFNEISLAVMARDAPADYSLLSKALRRAEQVNAFKDRDTKYLISLGHLLLKLRKTRASGVLQSMEDSLAVTRRVLRGNVALLSAGDGGAATDNEQISDMLFHINMELELLAVEIRALTSVAASPYEREEAALEPPGSDEAAESPPEAAEPLSVNEYLIQAIQIVTKDKSPHDEIALHTTSKFFQHIKKLALEKFVDGADMSSVSMRNKVIIKLTAILVLAAANRSHLQPQATGNRSPGKDGSDVAAGSPLTVRVLLLLLPILEITMAETVQSTNSHLTDMFNSGAAEDPAPASHAAVNRQPTNTVALVRYSEFLSRILLDHIEHVSIRACYAVEKLQTFGAVQSPALQYTRERLLRYV